VASKPKVLWQIETWLVQPRDTKGVLQLCLGAHQARKAEPQKVVAREAGRTVVGPLFVSTQESLR
jgi:hypothetical protein